MKRKKFEWTGRLILIIFSLILVLSLIFFITKQTHKNTTEQLLTEYMNYINKHEYEKMYKMISKEHSSNISMEEFVKRNKNIYEGLETKDLSIKILNEKSNAKGFAGAETPFAEKTENAKSTFDHKPITSSIKAKDNEIFGGKNGVWSKYISGNKEYNAYIDQKLTKAGIPSNDKRRATMTWGQIKKYLD